MRPWIWLGTVLFGLGTADATDSETMILPAPQTTGGMPLLQALQERRSAREFSGKPLPPQLLSNLLWAAAGVNRPDSGKRTAPSARDWREIDIYVATADGTYVFDPDTHALRRVLDRDVRALTGKQDFVAAAPLNLVYVADLRRMPDASAVDRSRYSAADAGFIAQNVYLFCASAGLNTVVRGLVDREALGRKLGLQPHHAIILAQTVGYPN